ncbi:MAG: type II toxin-antitoxin system Phd/YefM family antitoxin [Actinomycetota bacterium]|nr:type II toxin-antitoxin system Phd/YefM family antitoxin [Actinomycetota bacterium]
MRVVNVQEAKTHLSRLLERVAAGEEVVLARAGTPVARLVPFATEPRRPGSGKGRITISDDFDAPLPDELLDAFEGKVR